MKQEDFLGKWNTLWSKESWDAIHRQREVKGTCKTCKYPKLGQKEGYCREWFILRARDKCLGKRLKGLTNVNGQVKVIINTGNIFTVNWFSLSFWAEIKMERDCFDEIVKVNMSKLEGY
jgi:hypothetical protein